MPYLNICSNCLYPKPLQSRHTILVYIIIFHIFIHILQIYKRQELLTRREHSPTVFVFVWPLLLIFFRSLRCVFLCFVCLPPTLREHSPTAFMGPLLLIFCRFLRCVFMLCLSSSCVLCFQCLWIIHFWIPLGVFSNLYLLSRK